MQAVSKLSLAASALLIALLIFSCSGEPGQSVTDKDCISNASPLTPTFTAHGGLEKWQTFKTLKFSIPTSNETFVVDLPRRFERITGQGYSIGFDGKDYWSDVVDTAVGDKNAKFLINLQFYFFAMPFVLADEGVHIDQLEDHAIGEETYTVYRATFGEGVGVAPEDQYILYVDRQTKHLEYLLYSVTYFNPENRERYNALHYHTWQEVGGLSLPAAATRYRWDGATRTLGDPRGEKEFADVELSNQTMPISHFQK